MVDDIHGFPVFTVRYGTSGKALDGNHGKDLRAFVKAQKLDELVVLSHGWNNSARQAMRLYNGLLRHLRGNLAQEPKLARRKIGVLAVIWPSKRFKAFETDDGAGQAGGAASTEPEIEDPMLDLEALISALGDALSDSQRVALRESATAAIKDAAAWPTFLTTLQSVVPFDPKDAEETDAVLFEGIANPERALAQFDMVDVASEDDFQTGGAASGFISGAAGAVGSVLNFATFYVMKRRAGNVGQFGVAHTLNGVRSVQPKLRIHLVGHSFGARVVTMTALSLNGQSQSVPDSLTLLQAAFSHNSFSARFPPPNKPGFFRKVMTNTCVNGPILVTHTFNDIPVRVAYSIASALSGDDAAFASNAPSQFGGLGANGAQHMGTEGVAGKLLQAGASGYAFAPGKLYNLNADSYIKGHSDIQVKQVGFALVAAMAATL